MITEPPKPPTTQPLLVREKICAKERVYLGEGHFIEGIPAQLVTLVTDAGGTMTPDLETATMVILNPACASYRAETDRLTHHFRSRNTPEPLILPYHWLTLSCLFGRGVNVNVLTQPVFINPKTQQPLRAWVSVNLPKMSGEKEAADAQAAVVEVLIRGGAIVVKKRHVADLLVVDPNSAFHATAMEEKIRHKRDHQLLKERDWVEYNAKRKKINWDPEAAARGEESDNLRDEEIDGRRRENDPVDKKAIRRLPAARQAFTPADEEFMSRFLAAYYPDGAWSSRKTFRDLIDRSEVWPIASNHTEESWHGRFKKDPVYFTKRIRQYIAAGIDGSLKTKVEREAEEGTRRSETAPAASTSQPPSISTSGRQTMRRTKPSEERSPNRKKALVGSDTDSEHDDTVVKTSTSQSPPAPETSNHIASADDTPSVGPTSNTPVFSRPKAPTSSNPPAAAGPSNTQHDLQGDSMIIDESLMVDGNDIAALTQAIIDSQNQAIIASQSDDLAGAETQAVLGDFAQIEAEVQARKERAENDKAAMDQAEMEADFGAGEMDVEPIVPDLGPETQAVLGDFDRVQAEVERKREEARIQEAAIIAAKAAEAATAAAEAVKTAQAVEIAPAADVAPVEVALVEPPTIPRATSVPRSPPRDPDPPTNKRPRHTEPIPQAPQEEMPAPHLTKPQARVSYAGEENGRQRVSIPVRVKVDVVGVTHGSSTEDEGDINGRPSKRHQRDSSGLHTPGPHHRLLREQQPSSSRGTPFRRKTRRSNHRNHSPDKVYASPAIPPSKPRPPPPDSPTNSASGRRSPSPPLRDNQRNHAILEGQRIAGATIEQRRADMNKLCEKYNISFGELMRAIDSTKAPTERSLKSDEIGRRLDTYFAQRG